MQLTPELVTAIGSTILVPMFASLVMLIVKVFKLDTKTGEAKDEARQAKENTINVSNGFASGVDRKLNRIIDTQTEHGDAIRRHLEWHLNKETQK